MAVALLKHKNISSKFLDKYKVEYYMYMTSKLGKNVIVLVSTATATVIQYSSFTHSFIIHSLIHLLSHFIVVHLTAIYLPHLT